MLGGTAPNSANMAGGERAVQRETLKAFGLSSWQVITPRLRRRPPQYRAVISPYQGQKTMTYLSIAMLLAAASLRTRVVRLHLAIRLLRTANALGAAGGRVIDQVERELGQ